MGNRIVLCIAMLSTTLLCMALSIAMADDIADAARSVSARHAKAVITVELVLKQQMTMLGRSSHEEESKSEVIGALIDPKGLTVISLASMDPSSILMGSVTSTMGMGAFNFDMQTEVASARLLLDDGSELPARVVLRDPDLDLAFIRPEQKPEAPLPHIDLSAAAEPRLLDTLVTLNRLGQLGRRGQSIGLGRVEAVVSKPRTFYVPTQSLSALFSLGCPAFTLDGKIVGLWVVRSAKTQTNSVKDLLMAIIVPACDIAEAASQVPEVEKAEEPTP